jgi:two-component system response regulator PilR (NtrC family)
MGNVLVCDDERSICEVLDIALRKEGHRVETVSSGEAAKRKIDSAIYDVVVTDIRMPNVNGIDVLRYAHNLSPESQIILITAVDDFDAAIEAVKAGGAFNYIRKGPGMVEEVKLSVRQAMEKIALNRQNFAFRRAAADLQSLDRIVGGSAAMQKLKNTIKSIATANSTVLVHGESGTGKELVARAIHGCSLRANEPFVSVNCGAFPETLLESELFGYVKGAFTGAVQNRTGLFEAANKGTIFLDEISETTESMQVKLLRVLQERVVRPVGGTSETSIDVRVIAATNQDLDAMVSDRKFREDLYYRLKVIPLNVPPLRERTDDIEQLANHFLKRYAAQMGRSIHHISRFSLERLKTYPWPGNVRQLENSIERSVALAANESELTVELPSEAPKAFAATAAAGAGHFLPVPETIGVPSGGSIDLEDYVSRIEKSMILSALEQASGVQTKAATLLNVSYRSLRHLLKKYDI